MVALESYICPFFLYCKGNCSDVLNHCADGVQPESTERIFRNGYIENFHFALQRSDWLEHLRGE